LWYALDLGLRGHGIKKILLQLDSNRVAGVFDTITAYDAGVDCVLQLGGISPQDVRDLVHGAMFGRGVTDLKELAVFIGGSDISAGEAMLRAVQATFFGSMRVSVMLDSNGCNTTAAAVLAKVLSVGAVARKRAVVLAGTGPVGLRTAALLAREEALVTITSRSRPRAAAACSSIQERFGVTVHPAEAVDTEGVRRVLEAAELVVTTGAAGVMLLPETIWRGHTTLRVLADVNAVPPLGIEGIDPTWDGQQRDGKVSFGALGIGGLKKKVHYACLARLFERNDQVLDAEQIGTIAREIERQCVSSSSV